MHRMLAYSFLKNGLQSSLRAHSILSKHRILNRKSLCVSSSKDFGRKGVVNHFVYKLNDSIKHHPAETIVALLLSDIGSIAGMYALLSVIGLEFSPDFAIAYGVSRPFRRLRLPFDIATASVISKFIPAISQVRLMDLAPSMFLNGKGGNEKRSWIGKIMGGTKDILNKYGAAYMIGSRLTGFGFVCILYTLIKNGMDVTPVLQYFGIEEVSSTLSAYAAAVVFSSLLYPATLGVSGYAAPIIAKCRKSLLA